jgi:2-polyprenyl-6-methoxyphenol hydroxylase-like FAD-dependent oxidoreductase
MSTDTTSLKTRCCIVGGGPAGMVLGLLLARAGIDAIVLEKHGDFLRDFRGDTIHPSTLEAMNDLGFFDELLALPHQKAAQLSAQIGDVTIPLADFSHLPTRAKFIAIMPQWHFLDFLARKASAYPGFRLVMRADVTALIEENGLIKGVVAQTPDGQLDVRADLTIGADGRHSTTRQAARLVPQDIGAPMDVLWFRLGRKAGDPAETFGHAEAGRMLILINRGERWQCGYVIAKGALTRMQTEDIAGFRQRVAEMAPFTADRIAEIGSWDDVKLLTVAIDRLPVWHRPGLLCIGDAAHAMSPVGGVGINIAIQDAIAAANLLAPVFKHKERPDENDLAAVQKRRTRAVRWTQAAQILIQNRVITGLLGRETKLAPPAILKFVARLPLARRIIGRLVGLGVQPERISSPAARPAMADDRGSVPRD